MSRGKIMRDTNAGPGIVFVDGAQKSFTLETHWKSSSPPKVGAVVEVTVDSAGNPLSVELIDETALAKEQAQKALNFASENGKQYFGLLRAKVGAPTLISVALLAFGWIFLAALNVRVSASFGHSITFYEVLKLTNSGGTLLEALDGLTYSGAGLYGLVMWVALLAPIASHFLDNKFLNLGYCAPLAFMLIVTAIVYFSIKHDVEVAQQASREMFGGQMGKLAQGMVSEVISATLKALSIGLGIYLTGAVAACLAFIGVKKFLASTATT
jgi:hypothetical protein